MRVLTTRIGSMLLATVASALPVTVEEKPDELAATSGEGIYLTYCASCHGVGGGGNGEVAEVLKQAPTDLTRLSGPNGGDFPYDRMVETIDGRRGVGSHGTREMPIWGGALRRSEGGLSEAQAQAKIRQLVHYIWSIQR